MPLGACTVCGEPVAETDDYIADFFGGVTHTTCLPDNEEDDHDGN